MIFPIKHPLGQMLLIIQPIMIDGKRVLDNVSSFLIPPLQAAFGFEKDRVTIYKPMSMIPKMLFDSKRNQYQSNSILAWLQQTFEVSESTKLLAVCSFDAYFGRYNYCFGEAIIGGRVSAVYLQRLSPQRSGDNLPRDLQLLFQDRVVKEAIHELGHTFGLRHCLLDSCIMYKSKTIFDTDKKNREFCTRCQSVFAY